MWFWEKKLTTLSLRTMSENQSQRLEIFHHQILPSESLIKLEPKEQVMLSPHGNTISPRKTTRKKTQEIS